MKVGAPFSRGAWSSREIFIQYLPLRKVVQREKNSKEQFNTRARESVNFCRLRVRPGRAKGALETYLNLKPSVTYYPCAHNCLLNFLQLRFCSSNLDTLLYSGRRYERCHVGNDRARRLVKFLILSLPIFSSDFKPISVTYFILLI